MFGHGRVALFTCRVYCAEGLHFSAFIVLCVDYNNLCPVLKGMTALTRTRSQRTAGVISTQCTVRLYNIIVMSCFPRSRSRSQSRSRSHSHSRNRKKRSYSRSYSRSHSRRSVHMHDIYLHITYSVYMCYIPSLSLSDPQATRSAMMARFKPLE